MHLELEDCIDRRPAGTGLQATVCGLLPQMYGSYQQEGWNLKIGWQRIVRTLQQADGMPKGMMGRGPFAMEWAG